MTSPADIPLLNTLDRTLAAFVERESGIPSPDLALATALTSYAIRQGHVCLDLGKLKDNELSTYLDSASKEALLSLTTGAVIGSVFEPQKPLILSKNKKLFFHRYWHYEQNLIRALKNRMNQDAELFLPELKSPESHKHLSPEQAIAIHTAKNLNTVFISGGPGTGKTTTILYIIAEVIKEAKEQELKIALAAPTGKAAHRISESLQRGMQNLQNLKIGKLPYEAMTIHRLLGYQHNSSQFRHNRKFPLPHDIVVVDEASMLDLFLFSKLLEALKPYAKLILLGDRNQLASIEAGSIFGDLIEAGQLNNSLARHCVEFKQNFRFGKDNLLLTACEAIKSGDSNSALETLHKTNSEIRFQELPQIRNLPSAFEKQAAHFINVSKASTPKVALERMQESCILTPLRRGPYGVEGLNVLLHSIHKKAMNLADSESHFSGQPVIITENNYNLRLFNGDVGVLHSDPKHESQLYVYFHGNENDPIKRFSLSSLPAYELAYALTVHKSQGSEYGTVQLVLPEIESPILTRELLYTALSRSRHEVEIWGNPETVRQAIERRTLRSSSILDAMS